MIRLISLAVITTCLLLVAQSRQEGLREVEKYNVITLPLAGPEENNWVLEMNEVLVTAYAPLDEKAVNGVCYSGDRTIGANGKKVVPGVTVAAPRHIPFGTKVIIEGFAQVFTVGDRGGKIKGNRLDICMRTQEEALLFGRQKRQVVYYK